MSTRPITDPPVLESADGETDAGIDAMNWMMEQMRVMREQVEEMYQVFEGMKAMFPATGAPSLEIPGMPKGLLPKWARG